MVVPIVAHGKVTATNVNNVFIHVEHLVLIFVYMVHAVHQILLCIAGTKLNNGHRLQQEQLAVQFLDQQVVHAQGMVKAHCVHQFGQVVVDLQHKYMAADVNVVGTVQVVQFQ